MLSRLYNLWATLRTGLWFVPTLMAVGAVGLAEAMVAAPSVVTTAMKPLRAAGHVVLEETAGGDARRRGYRLSKAGAAFFRTASFHVMVAEEILVGPPSEAERDTLKGLLLRLAESERL